MGAPEIDLIGRERKIILMNDRTTDQPLHGTALIRSEVAVMPQSPGVYRMLDARGTVLYVGKAKNLRKRVASYANMSRQTERIARMVARTTALELVTTHTEVEALLLEANLIKKLKPRYNVILRDDKSFPFILITGDHDWPQIMKHRGARRQKGEYFGPFASAGAVNRTLNALQRAFPLRSCSDSIFEGRTRPCLQYQIKRCTGPCVGRISADDYGAIVRQAREFLSGRSRRIQGELLDHMQAASDALDFETAAIYRDRIRALSHIQSKQDINNQSVADADVIAAHQEGGLTCVQVFFFRGGQNYGNRAYYPSHAAQHDESAVLGAFIAQFYDNKTPPPMILLNHPVADKALIEEALGLRADRRVRLVTPRRGAKHALVRHAALNARDALARRLAESASQRKVLEGVAGLFGLEAPPERIEVYDNSHIGGTHPVGAMIVAGPDGLAKNAYRKFNIKSADLEPGDDYAMMREVLTRRFTRLLKEDEARDKGLWPDLVLIDGGPGQLSAVSGVFDELGVRDVAVAAIAKGPDRNAGRERLYLPNGAPRLLNPRDPVLYFLQRLRDEAHRFAIGAHRARRAQSTGRSMLDQVPGIGARRKKALLHHFGSAKAVGQAGLADLERVTGISTAIARTIYDHFHPEG